MKIDDAIQNGRECFAAILAYAQQAEATSWNAQDLAQVIKANYQLPMRSEWVELIEQLLVNEGIAEKENAGWRDRRPDLDAYAKRKLILWAMADFDEKGEKIRFFKWYQKFIKVGEERLQIQMVCERYYDFIIYRVVNEDAFVLSEVRNHSSAMWTVESKISKAQVIETIRNPRWQGELIWDKNSSLGPRNFGLEDVG